VFRFSVPKKNNSDVDEGEPKQEQNKRAGAAEHRGRRTVHRCRADGRGRQENAREAEVAAQAAYTSAEHPGEACGRRRVVDDHPDADEDKGC